MKNFKKHKTTAERVAAHKKWCDSHHDSCDHVCGCCGIKWLDLEVEEEKPMPCPVCGSECGYNGDIVSCTNSRCYYSCGFADGTKEANRVSHDRLCKAVAAYKESEVK